MNSAEREVNKVGKTCQMCGTENGDKQKFCSACGKPLDQAQEKTNAPKGSDGKARTMILGGAAAGPTAQSRGGAPKGSDRKAKTMILGGAGAQKTPVAKPVAVQPLAASPVAASSKKAVPGGGEKTMLGLPAVKTDSATGASAQQAAPVKAAKKSPKKDVPIAKVSTPPTPKHIVGSKTDVGLTNSPARDRKQKKAHESTGSKTVLGMPALDFDTSSGGPKQQVIAEKKSSADKKKPKQKKEGELISSAATEAIASTSKEDLDAIDMETAAATPSPFAVDDDDEDADYDSASDEWPVEGEEEQPRGNSLLIAVVAAGIVAILVVGTLLYLLLFDAVPAIRPQIFPSPDGKSLMVALALPEAPPGTTIQVAGQSVPVSNGAAKATLALSQMTLGLNDIVLLYVEPGEDPEKLTFPIVLRHTIKDDLGGLGSDKPFITVRFEIAPEVRLSVEGQPAAVTGGAYAHKIFMDKLPLTKESDSGFIMHSVPFQLIDATGGVEQGEHVVAIPLSKLQIDRPAPNAKVATETVTCSGVSEEGATISINDKPVAVSAVGFSTTVPLRTLGEHLVTVVAKTPNKAPRTKTLKLTRVESLTPLIEAWSKDLDNKLDYPTIGRDPKAYVGKKVKLNGRVVNINTVKGVTAFILYVGEGCPAKSKCAVYVVFKGETEAGLQSWVNVFGTVRGTHAVDMQNGVKIEVPAVDAEFVVKSSPKKRGRKR